MDLAILQLIQRAANPVLDAVFVAFSMLGEPLVAVLMLTFVYWVWDKETGEYMAFAYLCSFNVNGLIKNLVKAERPIGHPGVRTLYQKTATSSSFPSGHAQGAATMCGALAWPRRSTTAKLLLWIPPVLIALSRVYLGVHWPRDVLAGLALGLIISLGSYALFCVLDPRGREIAFLVATALFLVPAFVLQEQDFFCGYGLLVGAAIGIPLEHRFIRFSTELPLRKKILRWLVGMCILVMVCVVLQLILPQILGSQVVICVFVSLCIFFVCPACFRAMHI